MDMQTIREKLKTVLGEADYNAVIKGINDIETSIPTTKNHYGQYMNILTRQPTKGREAYAKLLVVMGANIEGVMSALALTT